MEHIKTITVGELRAVMLDLLNELPDDALVTFGNGNLSFNRLKERGPVTGPVVMNVEFNELYTVTLDPDAG